jgi:carbamoyl-phosphate synthase large subunit
LPAVTAVLFTCAGQRVDIVSAFGRAGATTVAVDASPLAPALYHAHHHALVCRLDDPEYVPQLRALVEEHDVRLVVPLADMDQELLARRRDELAPALVLLPGTDVVRAMADKFRAHELFLRNGIGSPETWLPDDLPDDVPFPVLVKARVGYGSRNIYRCRDRAELDFHLARTPVPSMVQVECRGEEFSIDVFCDFDGVCLNAIPRTMIESKGGESIKGMTIADPELIELGRDVAESLPLAGPANVQCFREPDGRLLVTDVNPRFGGGFPLPLAAGSEYPALAIALANGERPEPRLGAFRAGVLMTRFFADLCLAAAPDGTLAPVADGYPASVAAEPAEA